MKKVAGWLAGLIFLSLWIVAEPLTLVVGGEAERSDALALRERLVSLLPDGELQKRITLREVRGIWLVELGPLSVSEEAKRSLLATLGREGFSPMQLVPGEERKVPLSSGERQRLWQWGLLGFLAFAGGWFIWRRFGEARQLSGRQEELEGKQLRLEREIEEGVRRHG
jgi:hypothetical protein